MRYKTLSNLSYRPGTIKSRNSLKSRSKYRAIKIKTNFPRSKGRRICRTYKAKNKDLRKYRTRSFLFPLALKLGGRHLYLISNVVIQ